MFTKKSFFLFAALLLTSVTSLLKAQEIHIGDLVLGEGIAFYVDSTGQHGWAVALNDEGKCNWGAIFDSPLPNCVTSENALADVFGYEHTSAVFDAIINVRKWSSWWDKNLDDYYTAFLAADFENGWYLPSSGQLVELYRNLMTVNTGIVNAGGTELNGEYWSSTEISAFHAWYLNTKIGVIDSSSNSYLGKSKTRLVRAVFSF